MRKPTWKNNARVVIGLLASLALFLATTGLAEDSFPPCWRGSAGATYENWSFPGSSNPANPDAFTNPNGTPQATITVGSYGAGWIGAIIPPFLGRSGTWDLGLSGQISLAIPNFGGSATSWKYVQVQVTYYSDGDIFVAPAVSLAGATFMSSQVVSNQAYGPGVWWTLQSVWLIQPAPVSETVLLTSGSSQTSDIDQVIVDTLCPAPGQSGVQLSIQPVSPGSGQVQISWPGGLAGSVLESTADLNDPNGWTPVPEAVQTTGCISSVTVNAVGGPYFYRLKQL